MKREVKQRNCVESRVEKKKIELDLRYNEDEDLVESIALLSMNIGHVIKGLSRRYNGRASQ